MPSADLTALDGYYNNTAAKEVVNATLQDAQDTWDWNLDFFSSVFGADNSTVAEANIAAEQQEKADEFDGQTVVSQIDEAVGNTPVLSSIWGVLRDSLSNTGLFRDD